MDKIVYRNCHSGSLVEYALHNLIDADGGPIPNDLGLSSPRLKIIVPGLN